MEVKPGFKHTEVGVIPDDWDLTPLVELIDASRSIRYGIVQPGKFDPSGRYMVRGQDYSTGWVDPSKLFRVSPQVEEPFKNARVKAGDVLITIVGASTGHIEVIPDWLDGANLTQTTARLAIHPAKAFSGFCKCYLQSAPGQRQVANYLKGAAQPGLNCGDIEKFRIPLPPTLPEQRAIATALSDVDGLLGGLDRLIAKKRDLKQAVMQQLLTGQTRLPGFHGEWKVKRLGDMSMLYQPVTISAGQFTESGYPVYGANGVVGFYHDFNHDRWQVTVTCRGSTCGTVNRTVEKCWITGNAMVVGCDQTKDLNKEFLYYLLSNEDLSVCITGTGQPQIVREPLANVELKLPIDLAEQTAIAEVLTEMDAELAALEQRREKTRALKQAMIQELLTGKTRLI